MYLWDEIWVYHDASDSCCVTHRCDLLWGELDEIGPATDKTTIECKQLLLAQGWSRKDIKQITIEQPEATMEFPQVFATDFLTPSNKVYKGVAAMMNMDPGFEGTPFIITAPDMKTLERVWDMLSKTKLDVSCCADVVEGFIGAVQYVTGSCEPSTLEKPQTPALYGVDSLIWIYDVQEDKIFVDFRGSYEAYKSYRELQEIGPATYVAPTIECKQLLLKLGWSREDIREVTIVEGYDEIPF
jgi:hypothetical protein